MVFNRRNGTELPLETTAHFIGLFLDFQILGKGSFGVVYKAKWRGKEVAVKKIVVETELKSIQNEKIQLARVSHSNIIKLYGECKNPVALVIEFAECGSLNDGKL